MVRVHISHVHVSPGPGFDSMSPDLSRRTTAHSAESTEGQETEKTADKAPLSRGRDLLSRFVPPAGGSTPTVWQADNIWGLLTACLFCCPMHLASLFSCGLFVLFYLLVFLCSVVSVGCLCGLVVLIFLVGV